MPRWVTAMLVAVLAVAGCTDDDSQQALCASTDYILPSSTLQDLVTYADEVAVVTILETGREVTLRVDEVVWSSPRGREVPDEVTFIWYGTDEDEPVAACDQPALERGRRYLLGLVEFVADDWGPMGGPFVLTVDDDGTVEGVVDDGPLSDLDGRSAAEVGAALDDVAPDPEVPTDPDLPAADRFLASLPPDE